MVVKYQIEAITATYTFTYVAVPGRNRRLFHIAITEKIAFENWTFFALINTL